MKKLFLTLLKFKYLFIISIALNFILLPVWNFKSDDLYTHIHRGRMVAKYNANPYSVPYDSFKFDELYSETRTVWSSELSIYGPVFTLFGALVAFIAQDSLLAHIIIYKIIYSILNILVGLFIYKLTRSKLAFALYAFNPLIIFEIQFNNHLEMLMIFPVIFSLYILITKKNWKWFVLALSILTVGSLTKFFSFILVPFYILYAIKKLKSIKERLAFLIVGGCVQIVIVFLSYLPFIDSIYLINSFLSVSGGVYTFPSPGVFILGKISQYAFLLFYVVLLLKSAMTKSFTDKKEFVKTLLLVFVGFTFIYLNLLLPWYCLSVLTFLALYYGLTKGSKYIYFSGAIVIYAFLLYLVI